MESNQRKLTIGVIGCGHWGPNHIRVFSELEHSRVIACADTNVIRRARIMQRFPRVTAADDYRRVLGNPEVDAVVIATPTDTHAVMAREALQSGKHVLVEKPMCRTSAEAMELVELARATGKVLMVGHVFLFNNGIRRLRDTIVGGALGRVHYMDAVRTNLGPVRGDVNALYDLGTHDISIMNYLMGALPTEVSALGRCISQATVEDVCFATLKYPDDTLGHIHISWMNPRKVRTLTVVGEQKMAHWDDVDPDATLRLYDKGFAEPPYYDSYGEFRCLLRNADVHLPAVHKTEPLVAQAEAFVNWVRTGVPAGPTAQDGVNVVRILEAAAQSMRSGGGMVRIGGTTPEVCKSATVAARNVVFNDEGAYPAIADHTAAGHERSTL